MNTIRNSILTIVAIATVLVGAPANAEPGDIVTPCPWPLVNAEQVCTEQVVQTITSLQQLVQDQHNTIAVLNRRVADLRTKVQVKQRKIRTLREQVRDLGAEPVA